MGSLRISKDGMGTLEFIPSSRLLRFLGNSDVGEAVLIENTLSSLPETGIELSGMTDQQVGI